MGTHPIFESDFDCLTEIVAENRMSPARESTLPQKEKQQFHKLVKCYEQKQFKQGLRYAKEPGLLFHIPLGKILKLIERDF